MILYHIVHESVMFFSVVGFMVWDSKEPVITSRQLAAGCLDDACSVAPAWAWVACQPSQWLKSIAAHLSKAADSWAGCGREPSLV